jgi:hypothetical protein
MFDPTIYENLKVVLEGAVYDLDLAGSILVMKREDRVDLATMSRFYALSFMEREAIDQGCVAEIRLQASMQDLSAEILEKQDQQAGCQMEIRFQVEVQDVDSDCREIEKVLQTIWEGRPAIKQTLSFEYGSKPVSFVNDISLDFGRKIDEGQIEDIPGLIDHMMYTVQTLNQRK